MSMAHLANSMPIAYHSLGLVMAIKSLKEFLDSSEQKDLSSEVFELESSHLLEVKLNGRVLSKAGSMVACSRVP